MTEAYFDFLHVVQIPEDPTGVFDFSLADTSGSSSGEWIGDTGSKEGYSNTSVLSLNVMLSWNKQSLVLFKETLKLTIDTSSSNNILIFLKQYEVSLLNNGGWPQCGWWQIQSIHYRS